MALQTIELLTTEELAARLKLETSTIREWARSGKIPVLRLSAKVLRFNLAEVMAALQSGNGSEGGAL